MMCIISHLMLLPLVFQDMVVLLVVAAVMLLLSFYWNEHELLCEMLLHRFFIHENEIFSVPLIMNYDYYYYVYVYVCIMIFSPSIVRSFTVKKWMFKSNQVSVARIWLAINIDN